MRRPFIAEDLQNVIVGTPERGRFYVEIAHPNGTMLLNGSAMSDEVAATYQLPRYCVVIVGTRERGRDRSFGMIGLFNDGTHHDLYEPLCEHLQETIGSFPEVIRTFDGADMFPDENDCMNFTGLWDELGGLLEVMRIGEERQIQIHAMYIASVLSGATEAEAKCLANGMRETYWAEDEAKCAALN